MKFDYSVTHLFTGIADTNSALLRLQTGGNGIDALISFASKGQCLLSVETEVTFSANGTPETIYERNEMNADTPSSSVWHTPTVDTAGTVGAQGWIPGSGQGEKKVGGKSGGDDTLIWSPDTEHLIRGTNTSGSASDIWIKILFNEV